MKGHKMPDAHAAHPNVTPLIDVVMCMIVFYMMAAKIGVNKGIEAEMELPITVQGIKIQDLGNTLNLNVMKSADGNEPRISTFNPERGEMVDLKITEGTQRPLLNFLRQMRGQNPEFKVILRADQNLEYRFIEPVLITCYEAQVKNVNYAARQPQLGRD